VAADNFKPIEIPADVRKKWRLLVKCLARCAIFSLIAQASIVVKFVLGVLILASLFSWWYIFAKMFLVRRAKNQANAFEQEFWGGSDLIGMYQRASTGQYDPAGMERIFEAGFKDS